MEAAQALADLTEISSQIESAVLANTGGTVLASTFADSSRGERVARAAGELLAEARTAGREGLVQLEAATSEGSIFIVRDGEHLVAAVTGRQPTVGLVFYDLKTCLRLLDKEQEKPAPKRRRTTKKPDQSGAGEGGGSEGS
jgi:predicted regulator of Ras-like GTPase activity (Roadblock/LC7/MglB family)